MSRRRVLTVEADGGSRGNPGPAGYGAVVRDGAAVLAERAAGIGRATNNVAEYRGLIAGLTAALELDPEAELEVRMDSKLVVEQMSGRWKVKHPDMRPLASEASELVRRFPRVSFAWIPRAQNAVADRLANEAMDAAAQGRSWSTSASSVPDPVPLAPEPAAGAAAPLGGSGSGSGWVAATGTATRTLLLRHGQTAHSVERRFSGVAGDPQLTATGRAQARAAAGMLRSAPFDVVVSSPLRRARETAEVLGREVLVDDGFRETDFGQWEGFTFSEIAQRWPDEMQAWLADPTVAPPDGESFADTEVRVREALARTLATYQGGRVVVVSHVTPIKTMVRIALEAPPSALYRLHLDLASVSTIDWYEDGPSVVRSVNVTPQAPSSDQA